MGALHPQNPRKDQLLEGFKTAQSSINSYAEITVKSQILMETKILMIIMNIKMIKNIIILKY